ncbi:MAG TPA: hypothetical protein VFS77_18065, partial [Pyrinomonadaceae bacterium]|nr:hypothetical protein [Pyrinomonadaceae bacterium]
MDQRSRSMDLTIDSGDRKGEKNRANPILVTGAAGCVGGIEHTATELLLSIDRYHRLIDSPSRLWFTSLRYHT